MRRLYALFVAVDQYASKQITPLRGCVKDVRNLESFLLDRFEGQVDLHLRLLENEKATYRNVIETFRAHLAQAGPGDTAWFHFSGHGSEELSAFPKLMEPTGKEQTLLCHDSQSGGTPNLADKELAALLHEISTVDADGNPKEAPHVIVSLDACHSGSGTRDIGDELIIPRATATSGQVRSLESYYDGYYARQDKLDIPLSKHLLMSACEHVQTAGDTTRGGIFSSSLVQALKETKGETNYVDLFQRTRASAKRLREFQNPQFQAISNFNPYTRFITGESLGRPDKYEILEENGTWYIKCGAIHGLPTHPDKPLEVEIRTPDPEDKKIGAAVITSVGAQKSKLDFDTGFSFKKLIDQLVPGEEAYRGVVMQFPAPPFHVQLNESGGSLEKVREKWNVSRNLQIAGPAEEMEAILEVRQADGKFLIMDKNLKQEAFRTADTSADAAEIIVDALDRIANWYRTWDLENKNEHSKLADLVDFRVLTEDKSGEKTVRSGSEVRIYLNTDNTVSNAEFGLDPEMRMLMLHPQAVIKNAKQDLFLYLLQFRSDYSIACDEDEVKFVYDMDAYQTPYEVTQALWKSTTHASGLMPGQDESTTRFKLIMTTEELDIAQLTQEKLRSDRTGGTIRLQRAKISNDWWVHDMEITMIRQDNEISNEKPVVLADGQVRIEPHPSVHAKVSVANTSPATRSTDPVHAFGALQHTPLDLVSFDTERTMSPRNVLELDQVSIPDGATLEEDPLQIVLSGAGDDAWTLPVIFNGSHFVAAGDSATKDDQTVIRIREIPPMQFEETPDGSVQNPFAPEVQDRSLFQAAKLAFFKLVLKKDEGLDKLRRVVFSEAGDFDLTADDVASKVTAAQQILLVIHGLMGNTQSIIRDLAAGDDKLLQSHDLVLTFDYENLNRKLDETAAILADQLKGVGIGATHPVTILAHGSGGLVARWLIEQLNGSEYTDRLIMFGTPNAGTVYGKLGGYRKFASSAMDLALNFIPDLIPGSGLIMKTLGTAGELTGSLSDMDPASAFMNTLNSSTDPQVAYEIYCGDVSMIGAAEAKESSLLSRISAKLANLFQPGDRHDLFSTVESMQNKDAWTGRNPAPEIKPLLPAYHFSYFTASSRQDTHMAKAAPVVEVPTPQVIELAGETSEEPQADDVQVKEEVNTAGDQPQDPPADEVAQTPEQAPGTQDEKPADSELSAAQKVQDLAAEIAELKKKLAEKEEELQKAIREL